MIIPVLIAMTSCVILYFSHSPKYLYKSDATIFSLLGNNSKKGITDLNFDNRTISATNEVMMVILTSYSFRLQVIRTNNLNPILFNIIRKKGEKKDEDLTKKLELTENDSVKLLKQMVTIYPGKKTKDNNKEIRRSVILTIEATSENPEVPALIANAYVDTLEQYLKSNVFSVAKRNRIYLEKLFLKKKKELDNLTNQLEAFHQDHGIYDFNRQADATIKMFGLLSQQLFEKEIELENLKKISSSANPKVIDLKRKIKSLKKQIINLKRGTLQVDLSENKGIEYSQTKGPLFLLPLDKLPYLKKREKKLNIDIDLQQKRYNSSITHLEKARAQEANEDIYIKVLDRALVPNQPIQETRNKNKVMFCIVAASIMAGFFLIFAVEIFGKIKINFKQYHDTYKN